MQISPKMATPQDENKKKTKMDPKKRFFLKSAHFFELWKPVPESPHQTVFLGQNQYVGTLIFS